MFRGWRGRLIVAVVVALALAGAALAYFASTGSGSGSAHVGSAQAVTFGPGTPTTELFPGGSSDVDVLVTNPNHFNVHLNGIVLGAGGISTPAGCTSSHLSYGAQYGPGGHGFTILADANNQEIDLLGALSMDTSAESACQGAAINVYLEAAP